jgi:hypothetical protein
MTRSREQAGREFRRIAKWIVVVAVLMVAGALGYLRWMGGWSVNSVIATILGVFFSVVLGCGLFALAFFSDKSGHDSDVGGATPKRDDR